MGQRSEFVSVLAWIFIILSGLGLLILAMDTALFWVFPFDKLMQQSAALNHDQPRVPITFISTLVRWIFLVFLLLQAWVLASSIGLLLRKNWARISFIAILVIGMVWNALYLIIGILAMVGIHFALNSAALPPGMPPEMYAFMQSFMRVFMAGFVVLDIAALVLFGWIIKKLVSENIQREFVKLVDSTGILMG